MKILLFIMTISSIRVESAMNQQHMIRMTAMSRMRSPTPFRPGVNLRWNQKQGPSQRTPFTYYRGAPNRYNKYPQSNMPRFNPNTWKASPRQPPVSQAEADLVRAAASAAVNQQQQNQLQQPSIKQPVQQQQIQKQPFQQQPIQQQLIQQQPIQQQSIQQQPIQQQPFQQQPIQQQSFSQQPFQQQHQLHRFNQNGGTGAIHTIPAPNLSFSEKPIVVLENTEHVPTPNPAHVTSVTPRPIFNFNNHKQNGWKDPSPIKFGPKPPTDTRFTFTKGPSAPDFTSMFRNNAALQFASDYGFNAMTLPPTSVGPHQTFHQHTPLPLQGFQGLTNPHEFLPTGVNSIIIPPNMYQPNPGFMHQLQKQLLQRYPAVEFVPYHFDQTHQIPLEPQQSQQNQVFVANSITPAPTPQLSVIPLKNETKTQVVRETAEATVTSAPQALVTTNVTENIIESVSITDPQNATVPTIAEAVSTEPSNGTEKPITVTSIENYNTTPIFYAQVGQSIGNFEANGLYTAINDARASLMADSKENTTITTEHPDLKTYFIQSTETDENNNTINDIKPLLGVPFTKSDTVKIAYTLVRNDDKTAAIGKDGSVYAGQIVEASISDDQDFINEKAEMLGRRPPIRLVATTVDDSKTTATPKLTVVKAKIPPKSKLTFDDRTGEPILRIYASYLDSPLQKEIITSKLASIKHVKEISARKEPLDWGTDTYKSLTKHTEDPRTTQFGHTDRMPTTRAERTQPLSHSARINLLSHTERTQPSTVPERSPIASERLRTSERTIMSSERLSHTSEGTPTSEKVPQTSDRVAQISGMPQISERIAQTSERIAQTSERIAQTSERVAQTSERVAQTSERVPQIYEGLLTSETMPPSETVPMTSERYTHSYPETTFTLNTERSRPFERRPETTPTLRPDRKTTESRGFERGIPQIIQRDSYSKVSQFGHGHSRKPTEHSSVKPSSGRAHDNAIDSDRKLNSEINIGQFGLKLKSRMDDIVPIFDDY